MVSVHSKNIVGSRVREARTQQALSQDDLSGRLAKVGVPIDRAGIAKIENSMRRVFDFEVRAFSRVFKKPLAWFFGE
ncbi:MAG: XRE family transcriptional regulator [Verrucomicrobia bacterium]|nr:MAG: XRE family transcriptional regulator [Verrucomicrobiota bacterium]